MKKTIFWVLAIPAVLLTGACTKKYTCIDAQGNVVAEVRASSAEKACADYLE
ncbi:MAG: hypothetical protein IBJ09_10200 [Bacteroidia bacterium]|nr:hypothetical protein [Bacteroidia bacterium]